MKKLTSAQRDQLIEQYVELVVDSMDQQSLEQYVFEQMANYVDSLSDIEIKEEIDNHDDELYEELVDNVTSQPDPRLASLKTDNLPDISDNEVDGVTE